MKKDDRGLIKIDKNIPLPKPRIKYPWDEMEIGDSIFIPNKTTQTFRQAYAASKRYGKAFCQRNTTHGVRVWRIA